MKGLANDFLPSSGNSDILMVPLINFITGCTTAGLASLSILAEIPSCPVAFFELNLSICSPIKFSSIGLKYKTEDSRRFS